MPAPAKDRLPEQIVSGGQTGVDRGALDAAILLGVQHGGWCPQGRLAEDGRIPSHYQLQETESPRYWVRTRQNVIDSSATLILCRGPLQGGTALTLRFAQRFDKPCLVVDLLQTPDVSDVQRWMRDEEARVLNVAGPRESSSPGISQQAREFLVEVLMEPRDK
jgi:hypothetical protein